MSLDKIKAEHKKLLDDLDKKTKALKQQQDANLKDYTEKYRKLSKDFDRLVQKKKNIEEELSKAFVAEKEAVEERNQAVKVKEKETDKLLSDAGVLKNETEKLKDELVKNRRDLERMKIDQTREYDVKMKGVSERGEKVAKQLAELVDKHEKADEMLALHEKKRSEIRDGIRELNKKEGEISRISNENTVKLEAIEKKLAKNELSVSEYKEIVDKNFEILQGIIKERSNLLRLRKELSVRELKIVEDQKKIEHDYIEIAGLKKDWQKKLDEATILYNEQKSKGRH